MQIEDEEAMEMTLTDLGLWNSKVKPLFKMKVLPERVALIIRIHRGDPLIPSVGIQNTRCILGELGGYLGDGNRPQVT